jgi:DNA polymerase III epsilon subunit-like protein
MNFSKVLWLDTETSGLDPKVSNILELAWMTEVDKNRGEMRRFKVQPIFHSEDMVYGPLAPNGKDIQTFCKEYNSTFHEKDPDALRTFSFPDGDPLFIYAKGALTFNVPPPDILNPMDWVIGDVVTAKQALYQLIDDLGDSMGRWVMAGHNITFDYEMLHWWSKRLLGPEHKLLMDKLNKYVFLDTLDLSRWFQYTGELKTKKADLSTVAAYLGIDVTKAHTADADVRFCQEIVKILLKMEDQEHT